MQEDGGYALFSYSFYKKGKEAVYAFHIKGTEAIGRYEYITERRTLDLLEEEYRGLLRQSSPLVKIHFEDYIVNNNLSSENENVYALLSSLSLATMPVKLMKNILDKNKVPVHARRKIETFCEIQREIMRQALDGGVVREFVVIPSDDDLFAGNVHINLPLSICPTELYYTPEEYAEHIKNIIKIHEEKANYHLYLFPEAPFDNLQVINTGNSITVVRSQEPFAAFVFSEPFMVHGFNSYFNALKTKFGCDRNQVRQKLKRFL